MRGSPSASPKPQTHNDGKSSLKGETLRGRSLSGKGSRRPCKEYLSGNCTNPSCNFWHPPECQHYKTQSGCNFFEKWRFWHKEVESQPDKMPKKSGGKGSVASLKNSKQFGWVFKGMEPPKSKSILRKGTKFIRQKRAILKRYITLRENSGKNGSTPRCYSAFCSS